MIAEIVSTGTEILLGKTLNTSAFYLTGQLTGLGIEVRYHTTVGDHKERLFNAIREAFNRSQMVVLTGGLGPTADDLTKEIIAEVFKVQMSLDVDSLSSLKDFYQNKEIPPGTLRQVFFPEGSIVLPNDFGTAPGVMLEKEGKFCIILPGPPTEMKQMFDKYVAPRLQAILENNGQKMFARVLKIFGLSESELEQELLDFMQKETPSMALLDKHTYIDLRLTVRTTDEKQANEILTRAELAIRERLGNKVFGVDEESHSLVVGRLLRQHKLTLATAESCTGGLLGGMITAEAGSSDYYLGGVISYADKVKQDLIGVNNSSLISRGAVSEIVAREMAEGVRKRLGSDLGLATTGIAGPGGGTPAKPVGLVYIGLAHPKGVLVEKKQFSGNRESVRNMTVESALNMLRVYLLELD
ncbi:MAG: competence/damage-inducible protein A [Peptococcaceae bacterium]|nr:competence/damage-inducible protein A [Peptococcaceae bacterium]